MAKWFKNWSRLNFRGKVKPFEPLLTGWRLAKEYALRSPLFQGHRPLLSLPSASTKSQAKSSTESSIEPTTESSIEPTTESTTESFSQSLPESPTEVSPQPFTEASVPPDISNTQAWAERFILISLLTVSPLVLLTMLSLPFIGRIKPILGTWHSIPILERVSPEPHILSPPLVMEGGDPYVRALMRTISAAETNYDNPYSIVYGGRRVQDLSRHPDRCYAIETGPNVGLCTTAAGRYQFITPTWELMAKHYHPQQSPWWRHHKYSFEPQYQDQVVHDWLADQAAWSQDIPALLREGHVNDVFKLLASTWTSLSSGIEENAITPYLQQVYQEALAEELNQAQLAPEPS